ncbi:hypothetical protein H1R82_06630 [Thermoactinomyces intermedius]|uniref:hypothetical protein n=1 Tax=Thermoactinomyces intermedius TaxID=2024 RepID=UPI0015F01989|nr:hypothetical protein [Thermoactinomyces intermedius]MBA4836308.1 hypothetical protein [Thermoactinomyces intermedius]
MMIASGIVALTFVSSTPACTRSIFAASIKFSTSLSKALLVIRSAFDSVVENLIEAAKIDPVQAGF